MKVKIKKLHEKALIPEYSKQGDAGMDLTATEVFYEEETDTVVYKTGMAFEIPEGYFGMLVPRSSITKKDLHLPNSIGIIDSGYRGEIIFKYTVIAEYWEQWDDTEFQKDLEKGCFSMYLTAENSFNKYAHTAKIYGVGERIGQIIILPYPQIEFEEVDELSSSDRGEEGFGSTGK